MVYGYQGISIHGRYADFGFDDETYKIHLTGNGGPADITLGAEDGELYIEVEARNDAFDYDFHERLAGGIEREDIPGGRVLRFETVNHMKGTVVVYDGGPAKNIFTLEVF